VTNAALTAIVVTPNPATIPNGLTVQLFATGVYSDLSTQDLTTQVHWTAVGSTDGKPVASVSNEGQVEGLNLGTATITAEMGGVKGNATVNVTAATLTSIVVAPLDPSLLPIPSIPKNNMVTLIATCNFSDGPRDCTNDPELSWSSDNPQVAKVSNLPDTPGVVTGLDVGGRFYNREIQRRIGLNHGLGHSGDAGLDQH
jgi:uncharacterized protein YjdB